GASWAHVSSGLTNKYIFSLEASGSELFAGTWGSGVFRTSDSGENWTWASTGMTVGDIRSFPIDNEHFFVGTGRCGVFLPTDSGANWDNVGLINEFVYSMAARPNGKGSASVFAGTMGDGVFRSTDN